MKKYSDKEIAAKIVNYNKKTEEMAAELSRLTSLPTAEKDCVNEINIMSCNLYMRRLEMRLVKELYHPELKIENIKILSKIFRVSEDSFLAHKDLYNDSIILLLQCDLNELEKSMLQDVLTYRSEVKSTISDILENPYYAPLVNMIHDPDDKGIRIEYL